MVEAPSTAAEQFEVAAPFTVVADSTAEAEVTANRK
jgi:hypothetical protein